MDYKKVNIALRNFAHKIVSEAKSNAKKKSVSGAMANSISSDVSVGQNYSVVSFFMEQYGQYQDLGVKGKKSGKSVAKQYYGSQAKDFKYTTKAPPPSSLDKWVVRKGLAPRDPKGRFKGRSLKTVGFRKSITFLISRKIFNHGIAPSLFFTKPFVKYFRDLPQIVAEAYGDDFETFVELNLNKK